MTKSMMVAAVRAAGAVAGPALAYGKRGGEYHDLRRDHMIKKFDQDGDARLSRAERTTAVQTVFKAADSHGDGGLSWQNGRPIAKNAWSCGASIARVPSRCVPPPMISA